MQVSLLFAYRVASAFFRVYDVAVDTVLLCFLVVRLRWEEVAREGASWGQRGRMRGGLRVVREAHCCYELRMVVVDCVGVTVVNWQDREENMARHGGDPAHRLPVHFQHDLLKWLAGNDEGDAAKGTTASSAPRVQQVA